MIDAAAAGSAAAREDFTKRYYGLAQAYFVARWKGSSFFEFVDDAVHEMFVRCFCEHGALERADRSRESGFRPYFFGMARNVARKLEESYVTARATSVSGSGILESVVSDETSLSVVCDQSWAKFIMQQAAERQLERAHELGESALRRVELLKLRFHEGLPIRDIAKRWNVEAAGLHREASKAKDEFKSALKEVISFHHPDSPGDVARECARLLSLFQ